MPKFLFFSYFFLKHLFSSYLFAEYSPPHLGQGLVLSWIHLLLMSDCLVNEIHFLTISRSLTSSHFSIQFLMDLSSLLLIHFSRRSHWTGSCSSPPHLKQKEWPQSHLTGLMVWEKPVLTLIARLQSAALGHHLIQGEI